MSEEALRAEEEKLDSIFLTSSTFSAARRAVGSTLEVGFCSVVVQMLRNARNATLGLILISRDFRGRGFRGLEDIGGDAEVSVPIPQFFVNRILGSWSHS